MIILDKDEHVIFQVRQHWFIFFSHFITMFFLAIIPAIFLVIVYATPIEITSSGRSIYSLVTFFYIAWIFILWMIGFVLWTDYYLDTWIVTSDKVINVEQKGLFRREISILHIDKIQDVTSDVRGAIKTFINYGDVKVQTAGKQNDFIIRNVADPDTIREKLGEAIIKFKQNTSPEVNASKNISEVL